MFTEEGFKEVIMRLFNTPYSCLITLENLSLLFGESEVVSLSDNAPTFKLNPDMDMPAVQISYSNPAEAGIIALMNGGPVITQDMEDESERFNLNTPSISRLTAANLADLMYLNGDVSLCVPSDADRIHADISLYLEFVDEKERREPHYRKPPMEDIAALDKLRTIIEPIALIYRGLGQGESGLSQLLALMGSSATGMLSELRAKEDTVTVRLSGLTGEVSVGSHVTGGSSPYDFR